MPLDAAWLASATSFTVATYATPGPNNTMLAASGATVGVRGAMPHLLGVILGFAFMLLVITAGAAAPLRHHPEIGLALRWIGAAYLLWLAWTIATVSVATDVRGQASRPIGFWRAAAFQWINPKAWLIATLASVTYTNAPDTPPLQQVAAFVSVSLVIGLPASGLWVLLGAGVARLLTTLRARRAFNVGLAGLLVLSIGALLADQ